MSTVRHHLLEIILWPNGDGTFMTILNSVDRLKELGIYDDWKMTIPLSREEHVRMHGKYMTEETRRKMSDSLKGRIMTEEHKRKMSAAHKGKIMSEESRRKMSASRKGRHLSEETRRKISESLKARVKFQG